MTVAQIIEAARASGHEFAFPWSIQPGGNTILDARGVPVLHTLGYTSVKRRDDDGVIYNMTDDSAGIRARLVVALVNAAISKATGERE